MPDVATACGPVPVGELGPTLPHEHLFINMLRERRNDGLLGDEELVAGELSAWSGPHGATVFDLTAAELTAGSVPDADGHETGWERSPSNVAAVQRVSRASGVHVVLGTGHYRDPYLDHARFDRLGVQQVAEELVRDLDEGFPGTDARAGIIGEVGCDAWYVSSVEERSLRAAARASTRTGAAVYTHAARWRVGLDQIDILRREGVDPARIAIGHCDTVATPGYALEVAGHGVYVGIDTVNSARPAVVDRAVTTVVDLVRAGFLERILLSHDVCTTSHLRAYGGNGFTLVGGPLRERLLHRGLTEQQYTVITQDNPHRLVTR